ncbi:peptidase [Enterococcus faecalis]|uniref:Peptidase n=1 Tax=Enterococcus faecalis TaxID=1351 RepID=A0A8B3RRD9_ENTFL|nr:peptidase [Enterococcus faecalis]EGO8544660.1 peptidase [Enterococcus faecalis]EGO8680772.1 peptidase [Enterococcus faecalis]EGO8718759.1 peptidase [Enterococcus faecalis]EGO8922397.1 peptidase [Enterococcus faecalis]
MTLEKVNKIKGFLFVDKINRLLLYQRFKALIFKKHLSNDTKRFLWVILRLNEFERCFLVCR